jgi:hypothetical protein
MLVVPADSPFTTPVVVLIRAVPGRLLAHVPPVGVLLSVDVLPTHTTGDPIINPGSGLIVTVVVVRQPVGRVYVMLAVPAAMPVTMPAASIVATAVLLLFHVPPVLVVLSVVV